MAILKKKKKIDDEFTRVERVWKARRENPGLEVPAPPDVKIDDAMPVVSSGVVAAMKRHFKFGWRDRLKMRRKPEQTYLVKMEFSNGTTRSWIITSSGETFRYKGRTYYLRYEDAMYNLDHKQYELRFHEDYAVPIDRAVQKMEDPKGSDEVEKRAFFSVTSHNLQPLLKMEYVKVLAQAQELSKYLKATVVLQVLTVLILVFVAYYNLKGRGVV